MGRHSRKGRAKAGHPSEQAVPRGDAPPAYGSADPPAGASGLRNSYGPPDPRAASPGDSSSRPSDEHPRRYGNGRNVRGGHPEHREPGGGWGADGAGRGPEGGDAVGRVLQGMPGSTAGMGRPSGPRQDYVEAFDDDVFGKGATGAMSTVRAPAPRHPANGNGRPGGTGRTGPLPMRSPGGPRPGTPGPWNGYEGPPVVPQGGPTGAEPWRNQSETSADGLPRATPFVPAQTPRTEKGGRKGRVLLTGALAVSVTTVLAFVVAGQIAGSSHSGDKKAEDAGAESGLSTADGPASRSGKGGGARDDAQGAAPTYTQKLAKTYELDSGFKGKGKFDAVAGKAEGVGGSEVLRYRVDVEKGLPLDDGLFAEAVHKTLNDKRSWAHGGDRSFERVSKGNVDFVITLASSPTTDEWCAKSGLDTSEQNVSCDSASTDRVMINAYRWAQGSKTFGDDRMLAYRQMLINHEVGHRLGRDHVGCPKDGALAPVMMQQTKSLTTGGAKCRPNPWVYPRG